METNTAHQEPAKEKANETLPLTPGSPSFERVRVTITTGAWRNEKGWITGPKNEVGANPITTDGGICLAWFDSEIRRENAKSDAPI